MKSAWTDEVGERKRTKDPWDKDLYNFLKELRPWFLVAKIWGLNNFPHELLRSRVSAFDRFWSRILCVLSIALCVQAVVFLTDPGTIPDLYLPLRFARRGTPLKFLLPLFSLTMTILRFRTTVSMDNASYLSECRQVAQEIIEDSILRRLRLDARKIRAFFAFVTLTNVLVPASLIYSQLNQRGDAWRSFFFYGVIIENCLYVSTFSYVACYMIATSFYVVLPLLRASVREFEDASRTMDAFRLDKAVGCHEICCRLISCVDRIASYFFGTILVLVVPQITIAFASMSVISQSTTFLWQTIIFFISFVFFLSTFILLASAIQREAHKPEEILSLRIHRDQEFDFLSSRFIRRFRNRMFGYTFFGFLTFKKQTILSVLNIITTYLIVALQMGIFGT